MEGSEETILRGICREMGYGDDGTLPEVLQGAGHVSVSPLWTPVWPRMVMGLYLLSTKRVSVRLS